MKFRKKPVVIEAINWNGDNYDQVQEWARSQDSAGFAQVGKQLAIMTLEGQMAASQGDWIICGVNGEFYPCKPDLFAKTYEPDCDDCELPYPGYCPEHS